MSVDLSAWLGVVDPADLLPARRRDEAARIRRPLQLVGSAWLDDRHGYVVVRDARGVTYGVPLVVDPDARVRRAAAGDGTAAALVAALGRLSHNTADPAGAAFVADVFATEAVDLTESAIDVDQTNDLVVVGTRAVVKWDLHPATGPAGPSRLAALARAGFAGTPATWALVGLEVGAERFHVATVSTMVPDAVDGWDWAVDEVRALGRGRPSAADAAVRDVAALVADLHVALAADGIAAATSDDVARWVERAGVIVDDAGLDGATRIRVAAAVAPLGAAAGTTVVPIHGDLHVGQVLRSAAGTGYLVIDFDGSPTDDPGDRAEAQPPARDVASMLASWDHVGRVVLHRTDDLGDDGRRRVLDWVERSQRDFVDAYERRLAERGATHLLDAALVRPFQVLQECREYTYARRYLPHWRYVPDAALPALLDRPEGAST